MKKLFLVIFLVLCVPIFAFSQTRPRIVDTKATTPKNEWVTVNQLVEQLRTGIEQDSSIEEALKWAIYGFSRNAADHLAGRSEKEQAAILMIAFEVKAKLSFENAAYIAQDGKSNQEYVAEAEEAKKIAERLRVIVIDP
jgi:hypothetical protein